MREQYSQSTDGEDFLDEGKIFKSLIHWGNIRFLAKDFFKTPERIVSHDFV